MKNLFPLILAAVFFIAGTEFSSAQNDDIKNRDLKAIKAANQEAKKRQKEGWDVPPGSIPMAKQFEESWKMDLATDSNGAPKYLSASGNAVAGTKTAADLAAMTAARNEMAAALQTKVSQLIETKTANDQIDQNIANTLDKTVANGKALIQASLENVITGYKIYKQVEDKQNKKQNVMVEVKLFYDQNEALKSAQRAIRKQLEKESDKLGDELDQILNDMGWPE